MRVLAVLVASLLVALGAQAGMILEGGSGGAPAAFCDDPPAPGLFCSDLELNGCPADGFTPFGTDPDCNNTTTPYAGTEAGLTANNVSSGVTSTTFAAQTLLCIQMRYRRTVDVAATVSLFSPSTGLQTVQQVVTTGVVRCNVHTGTDVDGTVDVSDGAWHLIVAEFDRTNDVVTIDVDGVQDCTADGTGTPPTATAAIVSSNSQTSVGFDNYLVTSGACP